MDYSQFVFRYDKPTHTPTPPAPKKHKKISLELVFVASILIVVIVVIISSEFLTDNGNISSAYKNVYDSLNQINQGLPSSPTISSVDWTSILQVAIKT